MRWSDASVTLKACVNDAATYHSLLEPLKTCSVLYIDDFWKTQSGMRVTNADVKLAFDLLNYRYCNPHLITMISTELTTKNLLNMDEAVGGRILEMTEPDFMLEFFGVQKNWRLLTLTHMRKGESLS